MAIRERFRVDIFDMTDNKEYFQQNIELLFVLEGTLEVCMENKVTRMKADDILVINANKRHSFQSDADVLYMQMVINYDMVRETFRCGDVIFLCDSTVNDSSDYKELRKRIRKMLNHYVEMEGDTANFGHISYCCSILDKLAGSFMLYAADFRAVTESDRYEERLRQINNYINANYAQPISIKELSEKLYLSPGYLSRFFKKNYGMNFAGYLTKVRLFHAADDLLYTDMPITGIAYNNGFASITVFNKAFKAAYGVRPSNFREQALSNDKGTDGGHYAKVSKKLEKIMVASLEDEEDEESSTVRKAECFVDSDETSELQRCWSQMINIAAAANLLNPEVRAHLLILKQALGFEYVRVDSLFSKDFFITPEQKDHFNFSMVDSVLDFILEQGMKPHIELGLKPRTLHYYIGSAEKKDEGQMNQYSVAQWDRLMKSFMRHMSNHYGQGELDSWRMELWYDEDWRLIPGSIDKYLEFFDTTYEVIKSYNQNIQVGAYGIRMDAGLERRKKFFERWRERTCQPDFISIMYYGYERGEDGLDRNAKQTKDNDAMLRLLEREERMLEEAGFGDTEICICEWNLTPSVRNFLNDSTFKGAYIVKNVIDTYGMAKIMAYGAGSDRSYVSFDTPTLLFGGTGLLTKDGILKPAAFAYDFLNRLYPYYMGKTENTLATTDGHNNFGIVCHNQQHLNYNYYLTNEMELDKENLWKYFDERKKLQIKFRISHVNNGIYRVKVYRINDQYGSVLQIWGDLDYDSELSRNDIKYFRRVCEPNLTIHKIKVTDRVLRFEEQLLPNEIAFVKIRLLA